MNCNPPRVSVIVPTHNRVELLPRAVQSVISQTYADFEIIIVDDRSTDETPAVIARFTDAAIRSLRNDHAPGQSGARNSGIERARGEYIAFLDDDDEWRPNKLAAQVALLDAAPPAVGLIYGWRDVIDETQYGRVDTVRQTLRGNIFEHVLALDIPTTLSSWLVRASAVRAVGGFDEDCLVANDVDFICRLCARGWHVDFVPQVVLSQYKHARGQLTDRTPENLARRADQVRAHLARFERELSERPTAHARVLLWLARRELPYGSRLSMLASVATAFRLDPLGVSRRVLRHWRLAARLTIRAIFGVRP